MHPQPGASKGEQGELPGDEGRGLPWGTGNRLLLESNLFR